MQRLHKGSRGLAGLAARSAGVGIEQHIDEVQQGDQRTRGAHKALQATLQQGGAGEKRGEDELQNKRRALVLSRIYDYYQCRVHKVCACRSSRGHPGAQVAQVVLGGRVEALRVELVHLSCRVDTNQT